MDQHANAFSETPSRTVAKDIGPDIRHGTMTESFNGPGNMTGIGIPTDTLPVKKAGRVLDIIKVGKARPGGNALQDWIIEKGFKNGVGTKAQRDKPKDLERPKV
jgi:hypothetical protein